MSYPVAYRSGSRNYGNGSSSGKAFKLPTPYQPPRGPANDNVPGPANDNAERVRKLRQFTRIALRGRRLLRLHPLAGRLLDAYDLWRFLNRNNTLGQYGPVQSGFTLQHHCGGWPPATHIYITQLSGNPWPSTTCFSFSAGSAAFPINQPLPAATRRYQTAYIRQASPERFAAVDYYYRPSTASAVPAGQVLYRQLQRPMPIMPVDPILLPIGQPVDLPLPLPLWVPLQNAPFTRDAGPLPLPKPGQGIPVRQPPGPNVDERKLRGAPAVVRALQIAAHGATEAIDFIDALHDALPKQYQAKAVFKGGRWWKASPQDKARAVWENRARLDLDVAVKNLIKNHLTDEVIGRISGAAQTEATRRGVTMGVAF